MLKNYIQIRAILTIMLCPLLLTGCVPQDTTGNVIGGSDGPTTIYLASKDDKGESENSDADSFLAGTWVSASQGYEYYGTPQAMYYVRFAGTDINYGHMKDGGFVLDHTDTASRIEQIPGGGYIVQAKTADGGEYTYRSEEGNRDTLCYYETWNEADFPDAYRGGSSLSRSHDSMADQQADSPIKNAYESDIGTYYEMDDGTWMYDGRSYKYRLEITGRLHNAAKDSTFIYLSNMEDISFDRAAMASGLSSDTADYFSPEDAVFIGWKE